MENGHHDPFSPANRELTGHPVSDMIFQKRRQENPCSPLVLWENARPVPRVPARGMTEVYACTHKAKPVPCRRNCHISVVDTALMRPYLVDVQPALAGEPVCNGATGARMPQIWGSDGTMWICTSQRRIWSAISVAVVSGNFRDRVPIPSDAEPAGEWHSDQFDPVSGLASAFEADPDVGLRSGHVFDPVFAVSLCEQV